MVDTVAEPQEDRSQERDVDLRVLGNRPLVDLAYPAYNFRLRHLPTSRHSYANCPKLLYTVWYKSLLRRDGGNRSFDVTQNLVEHFHLFDFSTSGY